MSSILLKVVNKILRVLTYWVPYNLKYRPTGVQEIQEVATSSVEIHQIYKSIVTSVEFRKDFYSQMLEKTYDNEELGNDYVKFESNPNDFLVARVKDGRFCTDNLDVVAYIDKSNKLLSNVSFQYITKTVSPIESRIFNQKFFKKAKKIDVNVFSMVSGGLASRGNYSHWFIDVLPRIHLLKKSGLFNEIEKFIVPQYQIEFQKSSLSLFGIDESQIVECNNFTHIRSENLITSSHPRGERSILIPNWVYEFHSKIKSKVKSNEIYPKRIYICRKDSELRKVIHEEKLISLLSKYGFKSFILSEYTYFEKINLFSQAEFIVSAHGAGLTNIFYCEPETTLLEFFSEGFVDPFFYHMAIQKKMKYDYLIFKNPNATFDDQKGQKENVIVDLNLFEKKIKSFG